MEPKVAPYTVSLEREPVTMPTDTDRAAGREPVTMPTDRDRDRAAELLQATTGPVELSFRYNLKIRETYKTTSAVPGLCIDCARVTFNIMQYSLRGLYC